jgi:hypothetical protein
VEKALRFFRDSTTASLAGEGDSTEGRGSLQGQGMQPGKAQAGDFVKRSP